MQHRRLGLLGLGALFLSALVSAAAGGCQATGNSNPSGTSGPGGSGGGGSTTTGEGGNGTGGSGGAMNTGGGGGAGGMLPEVTIQDITSGVVLPGTDLQVKGVIAMSPKYLVSTGSSGSCLYGVYVSAPGLTETEAYSGILALSYGTQAVTNQNGELECLRVGAAPTGDAFPDDVRPGDILDISGESSQFLLSFCGGTCGDLTCDASEYDCTINNNCAAGQFKCFDDCSADPIPYRHSQVQQRQLFNVTQVARTGSGPVPTPHLLTLEDLTNLTTANNQQFHDMWGGVRVRLENVTAVPWSAGNVVNYGSIVAQLDVGGQTGVIQISNDMYYQRYAPSGDYCHKSPVFADPSVVWTRIDGFASLDTCIWTIQVADPCGDMVPYSEACMSATDCQ